MTSVGAAATIGAVIPEPPNLHRTALARTERVEISLQELDRIE